MIPCHSHPTALHGWIKNKCNQIRYGESQGHIANGDSITIFYVWWSFSNIVHSLDRHLFWSSVSSYLCIDSETISSSSEDHHWQSSDQDLLIAAFLVWLDISSLPTDSFLSVVRKYDSRSSSLPYCSVPAFLLSQLQYLSFDHVLFFRWFLMLYLVVQ